MEEFTEVARTGDLPLGKAHSCRIDGQKIAIFHTPNGFFATDDACPHRGGPLSEGDLMGVEIVCPWHLWFFNVETGKNPGDPTISVATHEVRVEGDRVLVKLTPPATDRDGQL